MPTTPPATAKALMRGLSMSTVRSATSVKPDFSAKRWTLLWT